MNAQEYRSLREAIGTRLAVAKHLGISETTLDRRERLGVKITKEAEVAIKLMHASGLKLSGQRKPRRPKG